MKTRRAMPISILVVCLVAAGSAGPAYAEDSSIVRAAGQAGRTAGTAVREFGEGAAKIGKDIGSGAARIGKDIGHGVAAAGRTVGAAAKEAGQQFARAFRGDSDN